MRFDDSLKTVLAADSSTAFGAAAAFRQLADLLARGRIDASAAMIARLRALRPQVPPAVRAATARALALADPPGGLPADLVAVFAEDDSAVAAAVLRAAKLPDAAWRAILPRLGPTGRAVLRHRGDLTPAVRRALESFGPVDFALGYDAPDEPATATAAAATAASVALAPEPVEAAGGGFEIAGLVDRIAAFQRDRDVPTPASGGQPGGQPATDRFAFETDAQGVIRWADATPRAAVLGVGFVTPGPDGRPQVDGVASGAYRDRTAFTDARLTIGGRSALAGDWRISGVPMFDPVNGRFVGFRGAARRPRVDEGAPRRRGPGHGDGPAGAEGLRRLVHELRTPANAISGFSELIEHAVLGPVPDAYRARAATIRAHAADLVAAMEDLELAARVEGDALELRDGAVPLAPLLARTLDDLGSLVRLRGCVVVPGAVPPELTLAGDERVAERLVARLIAAVIAAAAEGERLAIDVRDDRATVTIAITRARALASIPDAALLTLDAEREVEIPGAPLLGTGFAIRLARNLAAELGGALAIGADRLTLTLPAGLIGDMGQVSTN